MLPGSFALSVAWEGSSLWSGSIPQQTCTRVTRGNPVLGLAFGCMRLKLPLLRTRYIPPARAPILRYGVAVLSITLALIPALLLSDVVESRLVVFAVAIMVSAWYGGWKPGWSRLRFALTVSAYFSLARAQSGARLSQGHHTSGAIRFRRGADLLVQCRVALGARRLTPLRGQFPFAGHECTLRHLPLRCSRQSYSAPIQPGEPARL